MPFEIVRNDITKMRVDAIVNAANRSLLGGGGVDGAIHRAAGPELLEECRTLNGCETGQAKITKGYRLPARYVIHTVGPVWHGGGYGERELLASCYRSCLELAAEYSLESVAFPMISAGAYGYPKDEAMGVAVEEISRFLLHHEMAVFLVVFGRQELFTGKKLFRDVQEYIDDHYVDTHILKHIENRREAIWHQDEYKAMEMDQSIMADALYAPSAPACDAMPETNWDELVKKTDEGFSETLLRLIDEKRDDRRAVLQESKRRPPALQQDPLRSGLPAVQAYGFRLCDRAGADPAGNEESPSEGRVCPHTQQQAGRRPGILYQEKILRHPSDQ